MSNKTEIDKNSNPFLATCKELKSILEEIKCLRQEEFRRKDITLIFH